MNTIECQRNRMGISKSSALHLFTSILIWITIFELGNAGKCCYLFLTVYFELNWQCAMYSTVWTRFSKIKCVHSQCVTSALHKCAMHHTVLTRLFKIKVVHPHPNINKMWIFNAMRLFTSILIWITSFESGKVFKGQRVALRAKWSSHSNACGCLRHTFFLLWPNIIYLLHCIKL